MEMKENNAGAQLSRAVQDDKIYVGFHFRIVTFAIFQSAFYESIVKCGL